MIKKNIWIVDLESLDNRYTKQWKTHIPYLFQKHAIGYNIKVIEGVGGSNYTSPTIGAFFDFAQSIAYKATQAQSIANKFIEGSIHPGDVFFFTDAWNQTVHSVKYLSELYKIPVVLVGIWHAGAYDPTDILGFTIKDKRWSSEFERATYEAFDYNLFGTLSHLQKFRSGLNIEDRRNLFVTGYPFEWITQDLKNDYIKEDIVVFPHRINSDKAPHIFDALADLVHETHPQVQFVKTQEMNLSKTEYYEFLKKCKVVFSANKHENLGIGVFEAMAAGCYPLVPNKLSYAEMYDPVFKYDIYNEDSFYDGNDLSNLKMIKDKLIVLLLNQSYRVYKKWEYDTKAIQQNYFSFDHFFSTIFPMIEQESNKHV